MCNNATIRNIFKVNLATDFDPGNKTEVERYTTCFQNETWEAGNVFDHILTRMNVPRRYIPIHKCMHITIRYLEQIPSIGPHRPLWARYGEYKYLPPQRWLHNVEHGAIVALYHPCADPDQVRNEMKFVHYFSFNSRLKI